MGSGNGSRFQVKAAHALYVLGGILLGYAVASALVPDEPAVGQALGVATVGLLTLIVGQQTSCDDAESMSDE